MGIAHENRTWKPHFLLWNCYQHVHIQLIAKLNNYVKNAVSKNVAAVLINPFRLLDSKWNIGRLMIRFALARSKRFNLRHA